MGSRKKNRTAAAIVTSSTEKESIPVEGPKQSATDRIEDEMSTELPKKPKVKMEHSLDDRQVDLMMDLVEVPTRTRDTKKMRTFIRQELHKIENVMYWTHDGNVYVIKGEADLYPCIVAHTDTVHWNQENIRCFQYGDVLFAIDGKKIEQTGTGGDDKVGIWIALECIRKFPHMKAVFFRDEESGCQGSSHANMNFFKDTAFVLQCDRQRRLDITESISGLKMVSDEFKTALEPLVKKYERKWVSGMMTDVLMLAEKKLPVSCMNMSCGYYDPHTSRETINLFHMQETYDFVSEIIITLGNKRWPIEIRETPRTGGIVTTYSPSRTADYYGRNYDNWYDEGDWGRGWSKRDKPKQQLQIENKTEDAFLSRSGTWYSKKTGKPLHEEGGSDDENFRTSINDYCENCGGLLVSKKELDLSHCENCVKTITGNTINQY